ncbi:DUF6236 family protein [Streptomyces sp. NBC_01515]|uniref:DUF6236 family protein n=1 Tax=Streptomyces sp. NBC_01515 TaxID=2903890 RepID=UPI0038709192
MAEIFIEAVVPADSLPESYRARRSDLVVRPDNIHSGDAAANFWNLPAHISTDPMEQEPWTDRPPKRRAGVYWDEVAPHLREALIETGLVVETTRDIYVGTAAHETGNWLAMDPRLAWAYKCLLTEHLARPN